MPNEVIRKNELQEMVYENVYVGDEYKIKHIAKDFDLIIDAGAYFGDFARLCLDNGAKEVVSIEAYNESFEECKENCKEYSNWTGYHCFIAPESVNIDFLAGDIFSRKKFSLSNFLRDNSSKSIFLKMDIEGWEYHTLRDMANNSTINIPKQIIGEYHGAEKRVWDGSIFKDKTGPDKLNNAIVKCFFDSLGREFTLPVMEDDKHYVLGHFKSV
jgi:FkbM family methyltransferase